MKSLRPTTTLALALAGCVTINVYFPERQLQEAAEEIVGEVRPDIASTPTEPAPPPPAAGEPATPPEEEKEQKTTSSFLDLFRTKSAFAAEEKKPKDEKDIQIQKETPVIKKIKETLKQRFPKLLPFYEKGAIGEGADGYLAERDTTGLGLKEKRDLLALIKEENTDRKSLYTELAAANGVAADYIPAIGRLFAKEWQKKSKAGWWIEAEAGKWEQKAARKK